MIIQHCSAEHHRTKDGGGGEPTKILPYMVVFGDSPNRCGYRRVGICQYYSKSRSPRAYGVHSNFGDQQIHHRT